MPLFFLGSLAHCYLNQKETSNKEFALLNPICSHILGRIGKGGNNMYGCCNPYDDYKSNNGSTFVLIVVLFILLIIVGKSFC